MNYMTSKEVNEYIMSLPWDARVDFLKEVKKGFCEHCGWDEPEGDYCQCTNDS